jgi:hypothetical protein
LTESEDSKKAREYVAHKIKESEQISSEEFFALPVEERRSIIDVVTEMNKTKDKMQRSILADLLDPLLESSTRYKSWERNHNNITLIITKHLREYAQMPSVSELAAETGLSRQTVNKHVKEFVQSGMNPDMDQFRFMVPRMLGMLANRSLTGDVKALRLYFDVLGVTGKRAVPSPAAPTSINNQQNNFITINGMQITEEAISRLPEGQRNQLQQILQLAAQPAEIRID